MFSIKRRLYEELPLSIQRSICLVPFSILAGRKYRSIKARQHWADSADQAELKKYQEAQLKKILEFSVAEIPAYQRYLSIVERLCPFDALKEFPLLDKETLQSDLERYLPRSFQKIPHYETTTGGTSGNQLKIYLDDGSQSVEMAFMHRQWARINYHPSSKKATFRGVMFRNLEHGVFWQHNPIYNELQFSPYHLNDANLPSYVEQLIRFNPAYLHGYPSAIDAVAEFVIRNDLGDRLPKIKSALLGSEGVSPLQRQRIEKAFNTRVYSWYGHSERVVLAGECEYDSSYHHFPDYGILEIINEQGNPCDKEGDRGEIVGTGLLNYCMPLIRYRTEDNATRLAPRCRCGRHWDRFSDVEGRWKSEMIIGKNGSRISLTALNMHGPLFERVVRFQYEQLEIGVCRLNIIPALGFNDQDRSNIEQAYRVKTGDEVEFIINLVNDIPLTPRGKLKRLVSRL